MVKFKYAVVAVVVGCGTLPTNLGNVYVNMRLMPRKFI